MRESRTLPTYEAGCRQSTRSKWELKILKEKLVGMLGLIYPPHPHQIFCSPAFAFC